MQKQCGGLAARRIQGIPGIDEIRGEVLWGNLLVGGAGVEYYFGYQLPHNDLNAEDWRSRERTWNYSRIAMLFYQDHGIPSTERHNADALIGNESHNSTAYCFAKSGESAILTPNPG